MRWKGGFGNCELEFLRKSRYIDRETITYFFKPVFLDSDIERVKLEACHISIEGF